MQSFGTNMYMGSYLLHHDFQILWVKLLLTEKCFGQLNFYGEPVPPSEWHAQGRWGLPWLPACSLLARLLCLHWSLPPSGPSYSSSWPMFSQPFNHSQWKLSGFITHTVVLYVSALGPWGSFSLGLLSPGKFSFIPKTPALRVPPGRNSSGQSCLLTSVTLNLTCHCWLMALSVPPLYTKWFKW